MSDVRELMVGTIPNWHRLPHAAPETDSRGRPVAHSCSAADWRSGTASDSMMIQPNTTLVMMSRMA